MKALTVQQPWGWAIVAGVKPVENRTTLWRHRGPLVIHAGTRLSERGCMAIPDLLDKTHPDRLAEYAATDLVYGALIGQVTVVDVHRAVPELSGPLRLRLDTACCESPWAEQEYVEHGGRTRRSLVHLVLEDAVQYEHPIPAKGRLGLWDLTPEQEAQIA